MSTNPQARAWLHVRADALRRNYGRVRAAVGDEARIMPMVKADAYGLGVGRTIEALAPEKPWGWGVATVAEGLELRRLGVTDPVIVFPPVPPGTLPAALEATLHLCVSSLEALESIVAVARDLGVEPSGHVDVDTGMGRTGLDWRRAAEWAPRVVAAARRDVRWVGIFTHLHSADEGEASVREQWERFQEALGAISERPAGLLVHVLNSAGVFRAPEHADAAVRPGIFLYGGEIGSGQPRPEPVVSLHARLAHVRDAPAGTTVGYGATYRAKSAERWATLSIGYGDGLPRALGNRGTALVGGRRVPIIGRISMDMTVVDISDAPGAGVGDVATLLGDDGQESITVDELAGLAGTISYEILTGFTQRLPRVWTGLAGR
ncbi:MAG TPA: alanine racemase [Longimicrobiales bacterium]|nr:alanine racemase [Longimicrobiales bacterium]